MLNFYKDINMQTTNLVGVGKTSHTTHDAKDIVVSGVDTDLSSGITTDSVGGEDKLKGGVVDAAHVASARGLVLLRAKCE